MTDGTAKAGNFFNQATAEEAIFSRCCQKQGLNIIGEGFVGVGHLQLFLKI